MNNKEDKEIELELIVSGEVQGVGYRQYVKRIGRKLDIKGSVKNLEDGTVQILCKGREQIINEFKDKIKAKKLFDAPLIDVDKIISEKFLPQGTIKEKTFKVIYGEINAEIFEGNVTFMNYLNLFRIDTNKNFENMYKKYDKISQGMFDVVDRLTKRDESLEARIEETDARIEKIEKNIESLLKIISEKRI